MIDSMLFTELPICPPGYRHALVVEESPELIFLTLRNEEEKNFTGVKYFIALPETHALVESIIKNDNGLLVQKMDLRKDYGVVFNNFRTI